MNRRQFYTASLSLAVAASFSTLSRADEKQMEQFKTSLEKWKSVKEKCGGNYIYHVIHSSFSGARHDTKIVVKDNAVVERSFTESGGRPIAPPKPGEAAPEVKPKWVETGKEIGKHKEPSAAAAVTLDDLYTQAEKLLKADVPEHHKLYVAYDTNGILSYCFTRDTRIADDAPMHGVPPIQLEAKK